MGMGVIFMVNRLLAIEHNIYIVRTSEASRLTRYSILFYFSEVEDVSSMRLGKFLKKIMIEC